MRRASDALVKQLYEAFKEFTHRELRDADNPNLTTCSFNEVPPATVSHIIIPLVNFRRGAATSFADRLAGFRIPGAELGWEEDETGHLKYWVEIPIPVPSKKKKHKHHHHKDEWVVEEEEQKASCNLMVGGVGIVLVSVMVSLVLNQGQLAIL